MKNRYDPPGSRHLIYSSVRNSFQLICGTLTILTLMTGLALARDIVTISSEKTAVIDRGKGTAVWQKNVHVLRKSTGSTLITDQLSIERDRGSGRVARVEADGHVKATYFRNPVDAGEKPTGKQTDSPRKPHSIITCQQLTFNRNSKLVQLNGAVNIQSKEYDLQAETVRYDYQAERGRITAKKGDQVRFGFNKTEQADNPDRDQLESNRVSGVADEIRVDRPALKAVLQGNVMIVDHSDHSEFKAERAELFFDKHEEIESIIANGNFTMIQPGRSSKSDRAVFEYDKEEVTLIGNAFVKEKDDLEVSSARIKMFMKVNKGIITGVDDVPVKMNINID